MMKAVLERDAASLAAGGIGILDRPFIEEHTSGFDILRADIDATSWQEIVAISGLTRQAIESAADVYANARNVIVCYGMAMTASTPFFSSQTASATVVADDMIFAPVAFTRCTSDFSGNPK